MSENDLKDKTAKGLLWGAIGSGGMQVLNLAFGIILSRILTPADYGLIGSLIIFSSLASTFTESGFYLALANKKNVSDTHYSSVFWFNIVVGLSLYILLFFLATPIAHFYNRPDIVPLARFLFFNFFIGVTQLVPSSILFRNLKVKQRNKILLASVTISGIIGVCCALNGLAYWGIAIQTISYSLCNSILVWLNVHWHPKFIFSPAAIKEMLPYSVKQLTVSLFNTFNNNIFAVLLGKFYGMTITGFYTQGNKWTTMGYSTLNGMIHGVGQPVIRQTADDKERLKRVFRKMLRFTAFITFPAMFGLALVARELIIISVTDKWLDSVPIMHILCIGGAFLPFSTLFGNMFNSINKPAIYMWNTIGLGCAQLAMLFVTFPLGLTYMLIVYVIINILWLFVWRYFAGKHAGLTTLETLKDIVPYLSAAATTIGVTWLLTLSVSSLYLSLALKIIIAVVIYCGMMCTLRSAIFFEALEYITKHFKR